MVGPMNRRSGRRLAGSDSGYAESIDMMLRFTTLAVAGLLSLSCTAAPAGAGERLDAYLSGLDTVASRFEQRLFDENRNLLEQARGTVLIERPGRFRFDYAEPPQLIVGDGARVWIYDPELAQVTVREVDAALAPTPAILLTSERPVEESFRVEELEVGTNIDVFALEPKAEDASFTRIRLAFADGELRRMELVDQFGQTTLLTFHDIRRRPELPADAFTFTPPDGVDVVDGSD